MLTLAPVCPSCGAAVEDDWRNCGACGTSLRGRRGRGLLRLPGPFGWVLAALAVLILSSAAMLGAESRLSDRTHERDAARTELRNTDELLASMRTELADRVKERDALRADLDKVKGSLSDAQRSVKSQGEQLQTLKECLNAIDDLGTALDRGDDAAAREAYGRVEKECNEAAAVL